jgi:hypothetical protein
MGPQLSVGLVPDVEEVQEAFIAQLLIFEGKLIYSSSAAIHIHLVCAGGHRLSGYLGGNVGYDQQIFLLMRQLGKIQAETLQV